MRVGERDCIMLMYDDEGNIIEGWDKSNSRGRVEGEGGDVIGFAMLKLISHTVIEIASQVTCARLVTCKRNAAHVCLQCRQLN